MKNNQLVFKLTGTLFTALVVVLVIVLNWGFSRLGERFGLKVDMTRGEVFTLSEETRQVVDTLSDDVTIYYATNTANRANSRYMQYSEILMVFDKASDHIRVQEVNIDKEPGFARTYQLTDYNSVVVRCEGTGKQRVISDVLMEGALKNKNGQETLRVSYLESYLAAALRYTTGGDPLMVYIALGHGEAVERDSARLDYLMNMLYSEAMSVRAVDISVNPIPEDTDVLLIVGPTRDFTMEEMKALDDYLESGGRVQLYADPAADYLSNLNRYLYEGWALTFQDDCVSDSNEKYIALGAYDNYLLPILESHAMTNYFYTNGAKVRLIDGEANSIDIEEISAVEANVLLSTSEGGLSMTRDNWAKKSAHQPYAIDSVGKKALMVYLKKNALYNQDTTARLLLCGSDYLIFDKYEDEYSSYANKDVVIKSINYMSGIEDAPIAVASKEVLREKMENLEKSRLMTYVMFLTVGIPFLLFLFGMYVYIRRRRL